MKLCVAQTSAQSGDFSASVQEHLALIDLAVAEGASAIIFPELSLTGYEPTLAAHLAMSVDDARLAVFQQRSDAHQVIIGVGVPIRQAAGIWIGMVLFQPQQPRRVYAKQHLHPDEFPFFVSGPGFPTLLIGREPVSLAICYELSVPEHLAAARLAGATIYVASVSKSEAGVGKALNRLARIASDHGMLVLMANGVGVADGAVCAGRSAIWNEQGLLVGQLANKEEGILLIDTVTRQVIRQTRPADPPALSDQRPGPN